MDEAVRAQLARAQEELQQAGGPAAALLRWVKPDNIHLTLQFLGEIAADVVPRVSEAMQRAVAGETAFEVVVRGLGGFPSLRQVRVLFAAVEAPPVLARMQRRIAEGMRAFNIEPEAREFRPHLTLARAKETRSAGGAERLARAVAAMREKEFGRMTVREVVLMRSDLRPEGPVYTPLARAALG